MTSIGRVFFYLVVFLSRTLAIHRTTGKGKGPFFIPLYSFHPLTNIEKFLCVYFNLHLRFALRILQHVYLPLLDEIYSHQGISI